jgi:hypothetical protein
MIYDALHGDVLGCGAMRTLDGFQRFEGKNASVFRAEETLVLIYKSTQGHVPEDQYTATYSGFSIHDGTLLHSKSQYTTV